MTLPEFVCKALRVPFVARGRDWSGLDCWGLVRLAHAEVLGVQLPSYLESYVAADVRGTEALGDLIVANLPGWNRVEMPMPMDVALFLIHGRPVHVALVIDSRRALHTEAKVGTFVERLDSPMWLKRLEGVYRHAR